LTKRIAAPNEYEQTRAGIIELLQAARSAVIRDVNAIMTGAYRETGRRIVTLEQRGEHRAGSVNRSSNSSPGI